MSPPKAPLLFWGPDSSSAVANPQIGLLHLLTTLILLVSVGFVQFGGGNHVVNFYQTRVFHRTQTRVYGFENGRVTRVFGYRGCIP